MKGKDGVTRGGKDGFSVGGKFRRDEEGVVVASVGGNEVGGGAVSLVCEAIEDHGTALADACGEGGACEMGREQRRVVVGGHELGERGGRAGGWARGE